MNPVFLFFPVRKFYNEKLIAVYFKEIRKQLQVALTHI